MKLLFYFILPFSPNKILNKLREIINKRIYWEVVLIHFILMLGLVLLPVFLDNDILRNPNEEKVYEILVFIFGALFGLFIKTFLFAYILKLVFSKIISTGVSYKESFNIITFSLFPLVWPSIILQFNIPYNPLLYWLTLAYHILLITYLLIKLKQTSFMNTLTLIIVCQLLLFTLKTPFLGIDV